MIAVFISAIKYGWPFTIRLKAWVFQSVAGYNAGVSLPVRSIICTKSLSLINVFGTLFIFNPVRITFPETMKFFL